MNGTLGTVCREIKKYTKRAKLKFRNKIYTIIHLKNL